MRKHMGELLFILWLFIACAAQTSVVRAQTTVTVDPSSYTAPEPGHTFSVNITVNNLYATGDHGGLWAWMVRIRWNASVLNVTSRGDVKEGDFLTNVNPDTTFRFWSPRPGELPEILGRFNVEEEAEGSGTLVTITFNATAEGETDIEVYETDFIDFADNNIPLTVITGTVAVVPEFPASMIMPLFLIATAAVAVIANIVRSRRRRGYINAS